MYLKLFNQFIVSFQRFSVKTLKEYTYVQLITNEKTIKNTGILKCTMHKGKFCLFTEYTDLIY